MAASNGSVDENAVRLSKEQVEELCEVFQTIDINGDGIIQFSELRLALETVGIRLENYKIRELIEKYNQSDRSKQSLTFKEFNDLYRDFKSKEFGTRLKTIVHQPQNVEKLRSNVEDSNPDIVHSVRMEEQVAFSDWINSNLLSDKDLGSLLPLDKDGKQLYDKVRDGTLLCKLINLAVPDTIDERAINKKNLNVYTKHENLTLALNSAQAIGCNIVNIDAHDLAKGKQHLVLGLLWQIIRIGLFNQIDLNHVPGLIRLLREGETLADLQKMSPEQILIRWVNYHLENAGVDRRLHNFNGDITDSFIYTHLLKQIAPADRHVTLDPLSVDGDVRRADSMLKQADKLGCRAFVTANDVANGVYKLNLAFVANLFNTWPGLNPPTAEEDLGDLEVIEETREEKTYRNWMNSMGVDPYVNWLYADLCNGIIIFQLYDVIHPGIVDWKKVVKQFRKLQSMMDQIQNCNYAIDLGKELRFSLVGIQGKDIYDGNRTLTLALVWQLMRAYTLTVLSHCTKSGDKLATDKEIIEWVNRKLRDNGKTSSIGSFQDPKLSDARVVLDLIDAIKPGTINYDLFKAGADNEAKLANAKYAVSMARKIGAKVYALPEDIVELKPKMIMTVFACLMARDFVPNMKENAVAEPTSPQNSR